MAERNPYKRIVVIDENERLTQQQKRLAQMICNGITSDRQLAKELGISVETVRNYINGHIIFDPYSNDVPSRLGLKGVLNELLYEELGKNYPRVERAAIPYYLLKLEVAEFLEIK